MTRKILSILILTILTAMSINAQKPTPEERKRWDREMRQVKAEYIAKTLDLTAEQRQQFEPIYEAMQSEIEKGMSETRAMERSVRDKGDKATDLEYEKATEAQIEWPARQSQIEKSYYARFSKILTKKQLFMLKSAERRFTHKLMKERHRPK